MTHTDQAFIEAYRRGIAMPQSAEPTPLPEQAPATDGGRRYSVVHGPHVAMGPTAPQSTAQTGKAPLTDAIARRMREAAGSMSPSTPDAATLVQRFSWPAVPETLATTYGEAYRSLAANLLETIHSDVGCPVIGIAGIHHRSGATTTALAITRSLATAGNPVCVVDANPGSHALATSLGVLQTRPLSRVTGSSSWSGDVTVHAAEDHVSLVVAGDLSSRRSGEMTPSNPQAAAAVRMLRKQHAALVVDLGAVLDEPAAWQTGGATTAAINVLGPIGVVLIRDVGDLNGAVGAAQQRLQQAGATALGVVENLVESPASSTDNNS